MNESNNVGGDRHSTSARHAAAQRQNEALRLRLARMSYRQIAQRVGYANPGSAHRAVEKALKSIPRENATALRTLEVETLDAAQLAIMPRVLRGDLVAVDRLLKIIDQRARLFGLYENTTDSGVEEFKAVLVQWRRSLVADDLDDPEEPLPDDPVQITQREETP
ncbi:hypothetical protein [Microbacterium sp. bgisy189]|uniref:hypothetical protein n=1 Tax=Microbacterium sp. bgisy189 TaxID=3413798 RepID=UPI003EBBF94B